MMFDFFPFLLPFADLIADLMEVCIGGPLDWVSTLIEFLFS